MSQEPADRLTLATLGIGALVPVFYFGSQLVAAPFYPGYSFVRDATSLLGSDRSTFPMLLNGGAILTGCAGLIGALGILRGLRALRVAPALAWLTALAVTSIGAAAIWAGLFPLPNPRHNPGLLNAGMFVAPVLLLAALWRPAPRSLRIYLAINLVLFLSLVPVVSGAAGIETQGLGGLLQRLITIVVFVPLGVVSTFLLRAGRDPGHPTRAEPGSARR